MSSSHNRLFQAEQDLARSPAPLFAEREAPAPEEKVNILLVDDRADKLLALQAVLQDLNQNVVTARSGKEALRHLLQTEFAVILLDVSMPGMDGFETASLIRKRPSTEHTPIIFVTSINQSESQMMKGYQLGAVDYILSPIVPNVLRSKVCVFVELYRKTQEVKRQAERLRVIEEAALKRQLTEAVDRLEAETRRNRFFTMSIDMLAIADFDGYFLQLNPTWEKVLGYSNDELKARAGPEFAHPEDKAAMTEQLRRLREGVETTYFEGRYRCKDGSVRWLGWTAAGLPAEGLIYIFARDITRQKLAELEIKNLNEELSRRVQQLTEINKELESFSYSISHDLRAPLRSMHGFAEALADDYKDKLDATGQEHLQRIVCSARYMDSMLNDLLEYSRLTLAQMPPGEVDLQAEIAELLQALEPEINARQAVVEVSLKVPRLIVNGATLRQILNNLVSNGLKFCTRERPPRLRITSEQHGQRVRLCVEDNGIGIAPEHLDRIFGLFERLHRDAKYPGTGIGLAIVRRGAERMGGTVGVDSRVGEGSRFWVEFPC